MEEVKKILRVLSESIDKKGFPHEPFIVQSDPREEYCFFIAFWRNKETREVTEMEVRA